MKIEVGKTYIHPIQKNTFQVLYVGLHKSFGIHSSLGEISVINSTLINNWEEVVPKLTITKWVNVYKSAPKGVFQLEFSNLYKSEDHAKSFGKTCLNYLDTIEITYTEKES